MASVSALDMEIKADMEWLANLASSFSRLLDVLPEGIANGDECAEMVKTMFSVTEHLLVHENAQKKIARKDDHIDKLNKRIKSLELQAEVIS